MDNSKPRKPVKGARDQRTQARRRGLANTLALERYYEADRTGMPTVPGSIGLEPGVEAMCALLAAVSLRLNRERAVNRARLRVVK
jgi:hypothetical protein